MRLDGSMPFTSLSLSLSLSLLLLGKQAQTCLIGIACEVLKWAPIVVSVVHC